MLIFKNCHRKQYLDRLLVVLLGVCVVLRKNSLVAATLLAKSDLTICEAVQNNPHNVVDNKSCKKKIIIAQSIQSGQKNTESLLFTTNKIYDRLEKEEARLYYPFVLSISKSPLRLVYPYFYETTVNNHPYEEIRTKKLCRDGFNTHQSQSTCGFALDPNGEKIWDSQGFCCSCSLYEYVPKWLRRILFGGHANMYYRGGQEGLCGYQHIHKKNDKYSHCMRLDKLWYDVHSIGEARLSFTINIQAYDQVQKTLNNKTVTEWVDGGNIKLNYQKKSGVGQYGRLIARFHGTFASTTEIPNLVHKYLLIPKLGTSTSKDHVQVKNGFMDYMLIPRDKISVRESSNSCDMVGVSYSSFRKQGGGSHGRGGGCSQKRDSCLDNQPKDLFEEDTALRDVGQTPNYFVEQYGNCVGVNTDDDAGLVYQLDDVVRNSMITLEVSADDMVLIYNRASGIIVKSFATDFDAMSRDGKMTVIVQNTGLVTSNFYVVFADCSEGVFRNHEKMASINPRSIHTFNYEINVFQEKGQRHFCTVELYDSRRKLQDSSNVTFKTYTPCVCLQHCTCKCNVIDKEAVDEKSDANDNDCSTPEDNDDEDYDEEEEEDEESNKSIFDKIMDLITETIGLHVRTAILILLLFLGFCKAMLGRYALGIAKCGLGGVRRIGEKITKEIDGEEWTLVYNASMDLVDPQTNEIVVPNNPQWDFFINIFFFFLLPLLLLVGIGKVVKRFIKRRRKPNDRLPFSEKDTAQGKPEVKDTAKARRIIPKVARKMKALPKLTANTPKLKASSKKPANVPKFKK